MKNFDSPNRLAVIDGLRVVAILAVIFIHITSRSLNQLNNDLFQMPTVFFLNQASRFAVPLLFLLSGVSLGIRYKDKLNWQEFYQKRFIKIGIPYLIWSLIYTFIIHKSPITFLMTPEFILHLFRGSSEFHLYFIPALLILYIFFPILNLLRKFFHKPIVLVILFFLQLIILANDYYYWDVHPNQLPNEIRVAVFNLIIFIWGIVISDYLPKINIFIDKRRKIFYLITVLSLGAILFESYKLYYFYNITRYFESQWRLAIYIYTWGIAGIVFNIGNQFAIKFSQVLYKLSRLTFFVYFIHVLYISVFWRIIGSFIFYKTSGQAIKQGWFDLLEWGFVVILSFISAGIVNKIPKIAGIFGVE
jgi:probable poly-beta-1,6-N-acetyl-D-glucosamine export protein